MWIALWTVSTQAQVPVPDLNAQLFRPSLDSRYTLWTNDSTQHENHTMLVRVAAHYTKDPLSHFSGDGTLTRVISDVIQADVAAGYQLGPVRLGLELPVLLYADGAQSPSSTGFGDLALDVKCTVVNRESSPLGLAFLGRLSFPTGDIQGLRSDRPTAELEAVLDRDLSEKIFLGSNIGFRAVPDARLENWTDNFYLRLGLGYKTSAMSGVSGELISHGVTPQGAPSELMVGGWGRAAKGLHLRGGLGTALGHGIGTPQLRALFAVAYEPTYEPDTDGDGLSDFDDGCKTQAEDPDGVDDLDGCPEPTKVTVRVTDADGKDLPEARFALDPVKAGGKSGDTVELFGGSYGFSVSAEGYDAIEQALEIRDADAQDVSFSLKKTIVYGILHVRVTDSEGTPLEGAAWAARDTDYDGVSANAEAGEEVLPGDYDLRASAPGYRPQHAMVRIVTGEEATVNVALEPAKVEVVKERIVIEESVFFELGKVTIKEESYDLLDEVSSVIVDHPELTRIRIEGHTDSRGSAASNKKLSQGRADSVRAYMSDKGVDAERLEAVGFGEEQPLDPANNEAAWSKNRRVDFFIAERSD